jgi:PiT family inorganic phosphate transporter
MVHYLFGSVILGWALGSNDAANVFGTAVASRMVRYRTAAILSAVFILIGAAVGGAPGIRTLGGLADQTLQTALIVSAVAGLTVLCMTVLKLPVSASQAVVGAILGAALQRSPGSVQWSQLLKIVVCWVGTPVGAAVVAAILYPTLGWAFDRLRINLVSRSIALKAALLLSGVYGAYALGANNVANVTGMFYRTGLTRGLAHAELVLALLGGASIALGVLTFSRRVMLTVGSRLVQLGAFSALVAVLAEAVTVHAYSFIGVPVSTSQAIVGAVLGIGVAKSVRTISRATLGRILLGWVATPAVAGAISYVTAWAAG